MSSTNVDWLPEYPEPQTELVLKLIATGELEAREVGRASVSGLDPYEEQRFEERHPD